MPATATAAMPRDALLASLIEFQHESMIFVETTALRQLPVVRLSCEDKASSQVMCCLVSVQKQTNSVYARLYFSSRHYA
jgi:hypothetical protein